MKLPAFCGTGRFIIFSKRPATSPYFEPVQSIPRRRSIPWRPFFNIILLFEPQSSKWSLYHSFPTRTLCDLSCLPYETHDPPISFFFIWSHEKYLVRCTDHETPYYAVFSVPLLPHLLGPNIFLSSLFSNNLSLCFSLNLTEQVFTSIWNNGKVIILYTLIFVFFVSKWKTKILDGMF
jgi:hypothetical protein